ncbi:inorganic diphosphatase [Chitinophaga varians]|uniref:inorganic diphosphatase n=1 Tax=Chitinophaga varians TaxID=2202339 RepID=UPI00165ECDF0|nr:inorganic diphosphatase [Chitinophaga varians]MBC9912950.1 inorganic diphosphatase [Chitinophaga varians]
MKTTTIKVVIETPRGSTEKYDYDKKSGHFLLRKILPAGMMFPYDFGFIPGTKGEDGDPLDIIVLSEFRSFPGCMMECHLLGAIMAEQGKEKQKKVRNDRYLAIPICSTISQYLQHIDQLPAEMVTQLEDFFFNYNKAEGKVFHSIGLMDADTAFRQIHPGSHKRK